MYFRLIILTHLKDQYVSKIPQNLSKITLIENIFLQRRDLKNI